MRRLSRLLVLSTLSLSLACASSCKRTQTSDSSPGSTGATDSGGKKARPKRQRRKPGMPRPLRLPAKSPLVVHMQSPADVLAGLSAYAPQLPAGNEALEQVAMQMPGAGEFEKQLAGMVDLERPWDAASVDGELIVYLPIQKKQVEALAGLLTPKPPVGKFGAVDLQRGGAVGPSMAWLDRETSTLTLASSERGLATGRQLAGQYGKDHALHLQLEGAETRKYAPQFALESLEVRGAGTHEMHVEAKGVPEEIFARLDKIEAGALTGLLESSKIAAGASSKYTDYQKDVRKILGNIKVQVDRQNFLVKGTLQDLSRRLGAVMRSWNGRTMVGVGPQKHLLLGIGADNPKKMGGALWHLMTGVADNVDLARSLGFSAPKIRLHRSQNEAAGTHISTIAIDGARKYIPKELTPLLTDRGSLFIAVAFPVRTGAGMVVIGPECSNVLAQWLEETDEATPAMDSTEDFVAATYAAKPEQLRSLLDGTGAPTDWFNLAAVRDPTQIKIVRDETTVTADIKGPKAFRPRHLGVMPGRGGNRAVNRTPDGAKPARVPPAKGKPIR